MTQKNSSSWAERRSSCADGEVLLEFGIKEEKKLLTGPASLEIPVNQTYGLVEPIIASSQGR